MRATVKDSIFGIIIAIVIIVGGMGLIVWDSIVRR
jgi:hypothetical protein